MCKAYSFLILFLAAAGSGRGGLLGLGLVEEEVGEELVVARAQDVELLLHHRVAVFVQEPGDLRLLWSNMPTALLRTWPKRGGSCIPGIRRCLRNAGL